jgi:transposase
MVVLASASGNNVEVIARLVQTSPDRVREVIHRFNGIGLRCLDPQWAGGRPRRITIDDELLLVEAARTRPEQFGLPFLAGVSASSRSISTTTRPIGS